MLDAGCEEEYHLEKSRGNPVKLLSDFSSPLQTVLFLASSVQHPVSSLLTIFFKRSLV
jgi:hypothetical protein